MRETLVAMLDRRIGGGDKAIIEVRASTRAADIAPTITELQAAGAASQRAIAARLNARGTPTARGDGEWSAVQVSRGAGSA